MAAKWGKHPFITSQPIGIGIHKASLCVLLGLEILCSSTKLTFCVDVERMVCFPCVWLCFICVAFKITHINIGLCVFTLSLRCYEAHGELKMVSNQHIVNTKISWTHTSTNLLGYWGRMCSKKQLGATAMQKNEEFPEVFWGIQLSHCFLQNLFCNRTTSII